MNQNRGAHRIADSELMSDNDPNNNTFQRPISFSALQNVRSLQVLPEQREDDEEDKGEREESNSFKQQQSMMNS